MATIVLQKSNNMNIGHQNLSRSLERILEDAALSGELKLSCRKLKDFPKIVSKYNLSDTVIADLSRNRFCELPEDVTNFPFLETLLVYHNTLRTIPDSVRGLHSLSYLDLRSNQLSVLPREICLLPLQVLLVSNNRLLSLPEELGRMDQLTELDVACNQITHLPARMSDLKNLKSLSLRSNQLVYLPKELTYLQLVSLNISCNRIATLPVELRLMTSLVNLELENNPLTSPPASLCVRGLVHVFKYLDTAATKDEKVRAGDGHTTLRRTIQSKHNASVIDGQKGRRQHVDSGYSTSDGLDKRWSQETPLSIENGAKWSPTPLHIRSENSGSSTPSPNHVVGDDEFRRTIGGVNGCVPKDEQRKTVSNGSFSNREYKEALRQQRNQDSTAIYRPKEQQTPPDGTPSSTDSPTSFKSQNSTPSPVIFSSNQSSPMSPQQIQKAIQSDQKNKNVQSNGRALKSTVTFANQENDSLNNKAAILSNKNDESATEGLVPISLKKPVQKVTPSRNTNATYQSPSNWTMNGNHKSVEITTTVTKEYSVYVKPNSPTKSATTNMGYNNVPSPTTVSTNGKSGASKVGPKQNRSVSWNRDIPAEKLSFTMRREFDKQKEETELIEQLRKIIESRLKISLPKDVASALTDGVVLCHLANHVRPRSVASIHVPSAAVPKLTMARARRNVDNFLNACRAIGVDEELICSCSDIVPDPSTTESSDHNDPHGIPNPFALLQTVSALLLPMNSNSSTHEEESINTATNTKISLECDNYEMYFKKRGVHFQKSSLSDASTNNHQPKYSLDDDLALSNNSQYALVELNGNNDLNCDNVSEIALTVNSGRRAPNTLDLSSTAKKRKYNQTKRNFNSSNSKFEGLQLNGISEECEYDSDIGKFNCRMENVSDNSSGSLDFVDGSNQNTPKCVDGQDINEKLIERNITGLGEKKIVMKRIEFFESNSGNVVRKEPETLSKLVSCDEDSKRLSTMLCLGGFFLTALVLYLYPLPN